jgi:two-component system response regulator GlrR
MSRRILMIDDGASAFAPVLSACGVPGAEVLHCPAAEWGGTSAPAAASRAALLVPVAFAHKHEWMGFFGNLIGARSVVPVLAILRPDASGELLAAAARASDDFILWGNDRSGELRERIGRLLGPAENTNSISEKLTRSVALAKMVGEDPRFLATVARIPVVARCDGVVLILGETGTGKELCARAVHHMSARRNMPFIPVDCAALPDHLLENELFGHVRGAFTDAHRDQSGLVALAEGGTLFLDEIDSLPLAVQAKLLRLIEERSYKPLGGERFVHADIRIIAASNRPLADLVRQKQFRSDLFFRLNVLELHLPPLRSRRGDIALLARHFVQQLASETSTPRRLLAPTAIDMLVRAPWPGNVRELFNVIQRAVVFSEGPLILSAHLSTPDDAESLPEGHEGFRQAKERSVEAFERAYIENLLRKHNGNITHAAQEARKDRRAFARLIGKHKIDRRSLQSR